MKLADRNLFGCLAGGVQAHQDVEKAEGNAAAPDRAGRSPRLQQGAALSGDWSTAALRCRTVMIEDTAAPVNPACEDRTGNGE